LASLVKLDQANGVVMAMKQMREVTASAAERERSLDM
jgi:hypothetical protein